MLETVAGTAARQPEIRHHWMAIEDHVVVTRRLILTGARLDDRRVAKRWEATSKAFTRHREKTGRCAPLERRRVYRATLQIGMHLEAFSFKRRNAITGRSQLHPDRHSRTVESVVARRCAEIEDFLVRHPDTRCQQLGKQGRKPWAGSEEKISPADLSSTRDRYLADPATLGDRPARRHDLRQLKPAPRAQECREEGAAGLPREKGSRVRL